MEKNRTKTINKIKQYINIYAFRFKRNGKKKNIADWKKYVIKTDRKKECVSGNIDNILYS